MIGRNNREKQLVCGEIILFPDKKQVYKNEKEIILTAREYQLLEYLMYNQGNVLTKENTSWSASEKVMADTKRKRKE